MKNSGTATSLESDTEADPLEPRTLDFSKGVRSKYYDGVIATRAARPAPSKAAPRQRKMAPTQRKAASATR